MKNLENLKGAKTLSKSEQKSVIGGSSQFCFYTSECPEDEFCVLTNGDSGYCLPEEV